MKEQSPVAVLDRQAQQHERFEGAPTEVPFQGIEYRIKESDRDSWKPGIIDSNGGLVAAHDRDNPIIHIGPESAREQFLGYEEGSATVPLTGGDHEGWPGGRYSREIAKMGVNEVARKKGVKGRTISSQDGKDKTFTSNPFDEGDFLNMTGIVETTLSGDEIVNKDLVSEISSIDSDVDSSSLDSIGTFCSNNSMLAWVTPEGETQIAPYSEEKVLRLQELGYGSGFINVPHSNGESFSENQVGNPAQILGEIKLADMERDGQTMTKEQRDTAFAGVTIPSHFLHLVVR